MRRKTLFLGMIILLGLGGCTAKPVGGPLPTLAPEVREQEEDTGDEATGENEAPEEKVGFGDLGVDIIRYVERSRLAKDETLAATLETTIEVACFEYISDGTKLPEEPIQFRYTHELEELDDTYAPLKEIIREIIGDNEITLSGEGSYLMVEISKDENGVPKVEVKIMQE